MRWLLTFIRSAKLRLVRGLVEAHRERRRRLLRRREYESGEYD
jgi:hypothetical protein